MSSTMAKLNTTTTAAWGESEEDVLSVRLTLMMMINNGVCVSLSLSRSLSPRWGDLRVGGALHPSCFFFFFFYSTSEKSPEGERKTSDTKSPAGNTK